MSEIQKKSVRFDHLEPTYTTYSNTTGSKTYDLEELLKRIVKVDPLETKKDINGDSYVFHVCKYHEEDKLCVAVDQVHDGHGPDQEDQDFARVAQLVHQIGRAHV